MKSYCKGLRINEALVVSAYESWLDSKAGKKNAWRVPLITHQLWYADDIYLFSPDKRNLRSAARQLQRLLHKKFGLTVKPWKISRVSNEEPVDVVGYTVRKNRTTLRGSLFLRACRSLRRYRRSPTLKRARRATSYGGWFKHADCADVWRDNGFNKVFKKARAQISAAERGAHEHYDVQRNAA